MKKATNDWLISAESDLQLIQEIISRENLTHLAAFHAQQAIEKSFKAIIEEFELGFIKSRSLEMLYNKVKEHITAVINLYIDARYPGEFGLLPNGKPLVKEAKEFYILGKQIFEAAKLTCK